jgi:hypothetical protein
MSNNDKKRRSVPPAKVTPASEVLEEKREEPITEESQEGAEEVTEELPTMATNIETIGPESIPRLPPNGYYILDSANQHLQDISTNILRKGGPLGQITYFVADGHSYAARVEPHPPAPERGITDWHKGITLYRAFVDKPDKFSTKNIGAASGATAGFFIGGPLGSVVGGLAGYVIGDLFKKKS